MTHFLRGLAAVVALSCLTFASYAEVRTSTTKSIVLKRGSSNVTPVPTVADQCLPRIAELIKQDDVTKDSGQAVYTCADTIRVVATFTKSVPAPTCTAPKPTQEAQTAQCPAGSVGTWSQTRDYATATYPTCWSLGEWTPATAPAGICATPQTLVYACSEAGADGRILESATVQWPNCPSAALMAPSKALVVATNTGTQPHYWRLASKLIDEGIWAQTSGVGAWTRASAIDWGTAAVTGTANVRWTPDTENADGTPAVIDGYRIIYGTSATALLQTAEVPNGAVTSYVIEQMPPATYFFAVKAYNAKGESGPSNIKSKTLP